MSEKPQRKRTTPTTGLNLLDLADTPPKYIFIVGIVLKKINVTERELWEEISSSKHKRMDRETFDQVLAELVENKWLWKTGEGESAVYSGRLKRRFSRLRLHMGMSQHKPGAIFTSTWQMLEAKQTIEIKQEKATGSTPTTPRVTPLVQNATGWLSRTRQILIILLVLSAINFFAVASIDVTGVSGFVETLGTKNLPWISIAEMGFGLLASGIYIKFADRMPSLRLMKFFLLLLAIVYIVISALFFAAKSTSWLAGLATIFNLKESTTLLYPLLYLLRSQQIVIFPIVFWNLANSLYSMADARKVFPLIASGEMIGGLIGYTLFTELFGRAAIFTKDNALELLLLCGGLYLFILLVMQLRIKSATDDDDGDDSEKASFIENFKDGVQTIRAVPLFRYLAITVALTWVTLPILEYHFYKTIEPASGQQSGSFESFYSLYSIGLTLLPLILQWRIVPALTKRVELRSAFIILPVAMVIGALVLNLTSGVYVAALIVLVSFTIYSSWDSPMTNTLQYLVPEERRARVGALLNNYSYAFGKIFGSLVLGLILSASLSGNINTIIYMSVALVAALCSLGTAIMVRQTYEKSMLSWRIARRARSSSVLDNLGDF